MTLGDKVEDMFILLNEVKRQIPSITAMSSSAIAFDYQRLRVESVRSRLGLVSLAYLWKQDHSLLLQEMITKGIGAIIIKNLRIYFTTELDLAVSILRMVFTEAFREFAGITHRTEVGKECSFSFIPVLGSGNSTDFSDLITCELFATKL